MDKPTDTNLYKECCDEINNAVSGIYLNDCLTDNSLMVDFAKSFPNSFCAYYYRNKLNFKRYYYGEIITGGTWNDIETPKILDRFKDTLLVDEADIDYLNTYLSYQCDVTFSNYRDYIKIFGWRIALCWTNQIWAWERLQKLYGDRFKDCWISLNLNKNDYPELISWCLKNNKQIMVFVDAGTSIEVFKERFSKFITEFNKQAIK